MADRPPSWSGPSAGLFPAESTSVKRPYLLAPMSKLGDLGLYGKLVQRTTQLNWKFDPKHNGSKQYSTPRANLVSGEHRKIFLASPSWSTSTLTPSPLQMCQQHQVNNTMCMCFSIFTIIFKGFSLDFTTPLDPSNIAMLDCSSGTRWPICKQVCPSW